VSISAYLWLQKTGVGGTAISRSAGYVDRGRGWRSDRSQELRKLEHPPHTGTKCGNRHSDNDILDFALLWEPLGGPAPRDITAAFAIDIAEYKRRLTAVVGFQVSQLRKGITSREFVYGLSAISALDRIHCEWVKYEQQHRLGHG